VAPSLNPYRALGKREGKGREWKEKEQWVVWCDEARPSSSPMKKTRTQTSACCGLGLGLAWAVTQLTRPELGTLGQLPHQTVVQILGCGYSLAVLFEHLTGDI